VVEGRQVIPKVPSRVVRLLLLVMVVVVVVVVVVEGALLRTKSVLYVTVII
jgi:hypothetical protein